MANNFQNYYKKSKKKLSKEMIGAIERGLKYYGKRLCRSNRFYET